MYVVSIELEKQKAEHDRMMKLAEEKKQVSTSQRKELLYLFRLPIQTTLYSSLL